MPSVAWRLALAARIGEAANSSEQALRFGTKDAMLLFHAGLISDRIDRWEQAGADLRRALTIDPHFQVLYAEAAQQKLASEATETRIH